MSGLILPFDRKYMMSPMMRPPTVAKTNAARPMQMMRIVSSLRNLTPTAVAPTDVPSMIVTMLHIAF